tara:strand:- start:88 stop:522 length:435 start_codon:yes stop_codon:yes gene_type:complete
MNKNIHIGIVSGFFNPIHKGHLAYINSSKELCDYLVCIVNNDRQVEVKGSKLFMDEEHRMIILQNIKAVDEAVLAVDFEYRSAETLLNIREKYKQNKLTFFNSGDVTLESWDPVELVLCKEHNINIKLIDLPKACSSTELKEKL